MKSIFLSHNYEDKTFVRKISSDLKKFGIEAWIDEAELKIGDSLIESIGKAINTMDYLGVVLSPNSVKSRWVKEELNLAMRQQIFSGKIKVLPLLYKSCEIPDFLQDKLYADFTEPTKYRSSLNKLLVRLGVDQELLVDSDHELNYLKSSKNLAELSKRLLDTANKIVPTNLSQVILLGTDKSNQKYIVVSDSIPDDHPKYRIAFMDGLIGQCITSGLLIDFPDTTKANGYISVTGTIKSELVIPISSKSRGTFGAMNFESTKMNAFQKTDKTRLMILASATAEIIDFQGWIPCNYETLVDISDINASDEEHLTPEKRAEIIEKEQASEDLCECNNCDNHVESRLINARNLVKIGFPDRAIKLLKSAPDKYYNSRIKEMIDELESI